MIEHNWIKKNVAKHCEDHDDHHHEHSELIINNLKQYKGQSLLKQTVLSMVVKQLAPSQTEMFRHMFEKYDKDHSGTLTREEIKQALAESGVQIST